MIWGKGEAGGQGGMFDVLWSKLRASNEGKVTHVVSIRKKPARKWGRKKVGLKRGGNEGVFALMVGGSYC